MKQEDELIKKVGTANHFTVPENYFEKFNAEIMQKLPEKEFKPEVYNTNISLWTKVKPFLYMAAMFIGIALMFRMFNSILPESQEDANIKLVNAQIEKTDEEQMDDYYNYMLENSMMDDYTMFQYLSE